MKNKQIAVLVLSLVCASSFPPSTGHAQGTVSSGNDAFQVDGSYPSFGHPPSAATPREPAGPAPAPVVTTGPTTTLAVPEPTTMALGGLGAAALVLFRRRKFTSQ